MIQQEFSSITLYITDLDHKRTENSWLLWGFFRFTINSVLCWGFQNHDPGYLLDSKGAQYTLAWVAWRFWLGALNNKAGQAEEIGAGAASPLTVVLPTKPCKTAMPGRGGGKGRGVLRLIFGWYVPLASHSPYPITVYSVANYRPHLSHFWTNI